MQARTAGEAAAGAAIGALVGLLIGLSISQLAGVLVASLTALLAAFFGLSVVATGDKTPGGRPRSARMGSFALVAALGLLAGIFIRTHDLLGPTPGERVAAWNDAGYPPEEARALVAFERLGLLPAGREGQGRATPAATSSFLFSGPAASRCDTLARRHYGGAAELLQAMQAAGQGWERLAAALADVDPAAQERIARAGIELVCAS